MANADSSNDSTYSHILFERFPKLIDLFKTPEEFRKYWKGLVEMAKNAGSEAPYVFSGLPAVRQLFNTPEEFRKVSKGLVEMANKARDNSRNLFEGLLEVSKIELVASFANRSNLLT